MANISYRGAIEYACMVSGKKMWYNGFIESLNKDGTYNITFSNGKLGKNWRVENLRNTKKKTHEMFDDMVISPQTCGCPGSEILDQDKEKEYKTFYSDEKVKALWDDGRYYNATIKYKTDKGYQVLYDSYNETKDLDPIYIKKVEWQCRGCTCLNRPTDLYCQMCGSDKKNLPECEILVLPSFIYEKVIPQKKKTHLVLTR